VAGVYGVARVCESDWGVSVTVDDAGMVTVPVSVWTDTDWGEGEMPGPVASFVPSTTARYVADADGLLLVSDPEVEVCNWVVTVTETESSTRPPEVSNLGRLRVWVKSVAVAGKLAVSVNVLSRARCSSRSNWWKP
jgi:hypothetical protein